MQNFVDFFIGATSKYPNHHLRPLRFIVLALTVASTIVLIILMKNKSKKSKLKVLTVLGVLVLITEAINRGLRIYKGSDIVSALIPNQFSILVIYMMIITIFYKKEWYLNLTVIAVLFAGALYLIAPGAGMHDTPIRFSSFNSIFTHSVDFVYGVFALATGLTNYKYKTIWQPYIFFALCGVYAIILNAFRSPYYGHFYIRQPDLVNAIKFMPYEIILVAIVIVYVQAIYYFSNKKQKQPV